MDSGIKVCLICYPFFPSKETGRGVDRYAFELQAGIKKLYPEIKLHLLHQGFSTGVLAAGVKGLKLLAPLAFTKADLYHAVSPPGAAIAILLRKFPLVVTIHDLIHFYFGRQYDYLWKRQFIRFCTQVSARRGDAIIVPYDTTRKELVSRFNVTESKIHVVSYGVDHMNYYPRPANKEAARRVLYIGEVSQSKGVDALIRAFGTVKKSIGDVELLIGGKRSKDQSSLEEVTRKMGLRDVTFLGYVPEDELPYYYSSAEVMVYPSRYGFGLSTLEAMSCGTPVVVGARLDAPEFMAGAGILVDPDNVNELADAMLRILTDNELREELSKKARGRAKLFTWENTVKQTIEVYHAVLRI
jgi:glycosyltransferase involved in cell wall biosynthesis